MHHKFAFLMHPRRTVRSDMGELLGAPFSLIPERTWAAAFDRLPLPPMVTGKIFFPSSAGEAAGLLITIPFTPAQMMTLPRSRVQAKLEAAVDMARDMGVKIVGLGALTALTACLEVMDWQRFSNRKKVGSFIGCCPSEHSTGDGQLLGGIDRQGNRRLRSLLTEAVWRLLRWEPGWHGFAKWGSVIRGPHGSSVRKKKAVIACVRLLFIDLWRLFTGRATLADLGFRGAPTAPAMAAAQG